MYLGEMGKMDHEWLTSFHHYKEIIMQRSETESKQHFLIGLIVVDGQKR
jgi:hypothetical protein